jgi:integrase/recombinase XerC
MSEVALIRDGRDLQLDALFEGLSADTRRAYAADLQRFAEFRDLGSAKAAVLELVAMGSGPAHEQVHKWRAKMLDAGKSPATINRALSSLRSVMRLARQFGFCGWYLEVSGVPSQKFRDTRGPGMSIVDKALQRIRAENIPDRAARDAALLRLLFDTALRRKEIERLDRADLQLEAKRLGKARREKEFVTLPDPTCEALAEWLRFRGDAAGPLFINFDGGTRLLGDGIYRIMQRYGQMLGVPLRPHGLRHTAITEALDKTNGNTRAVQRFSRHKNVATLQHYDDNRTDMGGKISADVADSLKGKA